MHSWEGHLGREGGGGQIATNGFLEDQGIYYYVADVGSKLSFKLSLPKDTDNLLSV